MPPTAGAHHAFKPDLAGEPPEFVLILELLRTFVGPQPSTALARRPDREIDWPRLVDIADRHGIASIITHQLAAEGRLAEVGHALAEELKGQQLLQGAGFLSQRRILEELVHDLAEAGIPVIPLKGVALAERLYPVPALRKLGDLDLLVEPASFERAAKLLQELGYTARGEIPDPFADHGFAYHILMKRSEPVEAKLELHWLLGDDEVFNSPASPLDSRAVLDRTVPDSRMDGAKRLQTEDEVTYLIGHAAKHNWRMLYALVDIALYLRRADVDWQRVLFLSQGFRASWVFEATLALTSGLLGTPLPPVLERHVGTAWQQHARLRRTAAYARRTWIAADPPWDSEDRFAPWLKYLHVQRMNTRLRPTRTSAARYVMSELITPDDRDRELFPLPHTFGWLLRIVRPLRLGVAHLRYLVGSRLRAGGRARSRKRTA